MESDVGSYAIVSIVLNNSPYYIGHVVENLEKSVMIYPIVQRGQIDINGKWVKLLSITVEVSKNTILKKSNLTKIGFEEKIEI